VSRPHIAVLGQIPGSGGQWADTAVHPEDRAAPGITVLRAESGLFFANADHVRAAVRAAAAGDGIRAIVLDCETVPFVDITAARMLTELTADLAKRGVRLVIARDIGQVRDMLAVTGPPGSAHEYYRTVQEAVDSITPQAGGRPEED
jgi:SulP family sulfate permease